LKKKFKIEIAPQIDTESYSDISNKFFPDIIGIEGAAITDESLLDDFYSVFFTDEINDIAWKRVGVDRKNIWTKEERGLINAEYHRIERMLLEKIEKNYGIDISDMKYYYLIEIFKRIQILS